MSDFRLGKNDTAHFTSLAELSAISKRKPRKFSDKEKNEWKENVLKKTIPTCKYCDERMTYFGGNIAVCTNDLCKGIPHKYKDEDGTEKIKYTKPVYSLLRGNDANWAAKTL